MSKFSVAAAALMGAALAALHFSNTKSAPAQIEAQLKAVAQSELDVYKPQAILLVKSTAGKFEGQVLTHANALELQTELTQAVQKSSLSDMAKMAMVAAITLAVTDANISVIASPLDAKFGAMTDKIVAAIQGARL